MVLPLIGDGQVFEELGRRLGLVGCTFAQVVTFDDPPMLLFFSEEERDPKDAIGAVVCVPESILNEKRHDGGGAHDLKWHKQTVSNTCGTVALLNLALNLTTATLDMNDEELLKLHEEFAGTDTAGAEEEVEMHFVALLKRKTSNTLYELDGRNVAGVRKLACTDLMEAIRGEYLEASKGMMSAFLLFPNQHTA